MSEKQYRLIFKGQIADGKDIEEVKANIAGLYKKEVAKIEKLFSGGTTVIKKDATLESCKKTKNAFAKAGAICIIEGPGDQDEEAPLKLESEDTVSPADMPPPIPPTPEPSAIDNRDFGQEPVNAVAPVSAGNDRFCESCGERISAGMISCPKCGIKKKGGVNKVALVLLTFFLGGIGAHKFYIGKTVQGILYLLFFWTYIPSIIAFIEFIIYLCTSEQTLQEKYPEGGGRGTLVVVIIGGFFVFIVLLGIIAAIVIPNFIAYRNKAYCSIVEHQAHVASIAVALYYSEHSNDDIPTIEDLIDSTDYQSNERVFIDISSSDEISTEVVITATNNTGRCPMGEEYVLSLPESDTDGWQ